MKVIEASNVHAAFPAALRLLYEHGVERPSRNGPVLQAPCPVATVYTHPRERVIFWPERDANPFFHLYESLWMLAGRNDVAGPARYAKNMAGFSDDGLKFHGAYGWRWRNHFGEYSHIDQETNPMDQLDHIVNTLRQNPEDRRCVLQMWDPSADLSRQGKDLPCNLTATFQVNPEGALDLTVFCRSNDIVWGCYGANAVHFSFLLEYMAIWIGCPVGRYTQVSVNWHGYLSTLGPVERLKYRTSIYPYPRVLPMVESQRDESPGDTHDRLELHISQLLACADTNFMERDFNDDEPWREMVWTVLRAHALYTANPAPDKFDVALRCLGHADQSVDWVIAATEWVQRRQKTHENKQQG